MNLTKTEYILRCLSKIRHKKWELFIISRIIHQLDEDIEFITQQLVRRPDGTRALTDLYFPQLNLHLEIDEPFHEGQVESDYKREQDIMSVTEHDIYRIKISDANGHERPLNDIRIDTDEFVAELLKKKKRFIEDNTYCPWDFEKRYLSESVINRGVVSVSDNVLFRTQVEAMRCFGFSGKGWQRGAWKIPDQSSTIVWFPRLYEHGIWRNELSHDGRRIFERALDANSEAKDSITKQKMDDLAEPKSYVVFAKAQDPLGFKLLRYVGTFKMNHIDSNELEIIFDRIRTEEPVRT